MKRYLLLMMSIICILFLVACNSNETSTAYFNGKVVEAYDGSCLMEVSDKGNQQLDVGSKVVVYTNIEACPDYIVGDYLTVNYDGAVAESYPPQILKVSSIEKKN